MLVVTDINDIFLPLPDDMLVNLAESRAVIETLLNKLPNMFPPTQNVETATGTALKAAFEIVVCAPSHFFRYSLFAPPQTHTTHTHS